MLFNKPDYPRVSDFNQPNPFKNIYNPSLFDWDFILKVKYILSGKNYSEEEDVFQDFSVEQIKCKICALVYHLIVLLLQVNSVSHADSITFWK